MRRLIAAVAVLACAGSALAATAQATQPQAQLIEMAAHLTGPNRASGTWDGSGAVDDAGTYDEIFRFAGETIHAEKVLVGSKGTIVLRVQARVVWLGPCTVGFTAGSWHVVDGTGAYESLKGGGTPALTTESVGDVCSGAIHVTHAGHAHSE
jgi:hypothetical protein